jgi:hypothetical protein
MEMKIFKDIIWNRTRRLPACKAVPQRTAPLSAPIISVPTIIPRQQAYYEIRYNPLLPITIYLLFMVLFPDIIRQYTTSGGENFS